jgi:hypothetical protein
MFEAGMSPAEILCEGAHSREYAAGMSLVVESTRAHARRRQGPRLLAVLLLCTFGLGGHVGRADAFQLGAGGMPGGQRETSLGAMDRLMRGKQPVAACRLPLRRARSPPGMLQAKSKGDQDARRGAMPREKILSTRREARDG